MKHEWIFLQSNDLSEIHFGGVKKYQKISSLLIYIVFFAMSYLTLHFLTNNISLGLKLKNNFLPYVGSLLFQIFHTGFAVYFLGLCFSRLYKNHQRFKIYFIWLIIYFGSAINSYFLWFYIRTFIDFNTGSVVKLIFFKYIVYFFLYAMLLEIAYSFYFLKCDSHVDAINKANHKASIFRSLTLLIYIFVFIGYFSGSLDNSINVFNQKLVPFFTKNFLTVGGAVGNSILILILSIPLILILAVWINLKKHDQKKTTHRLFSNRLTLSFLLSTFLYFTINQAGSFTNFYLGTINYLYLFFTIAVVFMFFALIIWNYIKFNSSAYYFLSIAFVWLILSWFLVILYMTRDTANFFSKINAVILSSASIMILGTTFFNQYLMKRYVAITFNIVFNLISIIFLIIYVISSNLPNINLGAYDPFFILYTLISILTLINLNVLLINFTWSLKRLRKRKTNLIFSKKLSLQNASFHSNNFTNKK